MVRVFPSHWPLWRKLLLGLGALLLTLVLLAAIGVWILLGTENGRLRLVKTGLDFGLGDGPVQVDLGEMASPSLGEWHFARILVRRQGDVWLDLRDLRLKWQPGKLLQRRLKIESLTIAQLEVHTDAAPLPEQPEAETDTGGGEIPPVAIDNFRLDRLEVHGTSQAVPAHRLAGDLRLFWDDFPLAMNLDAASLPDNDAPAMNLELTSHAESPTQMILQGTLKEDAGGWLGSLLQLPPGNGIDADFETLIELTEPGYRIGLHHLALPLLNHQLAAEGEILLSESMDRIQVPALTLTTDEQAHDIKGSLIDNQLDFRVVLNRFPLDMLSPWVEQIDSGSLSTDLHLAGTPDAPRITGRAFGSTRYQTEAVTAEVEGVFSPERLNFDRLNLTVGTAGFQARGQLDLQGVDTDLNFEAHGLSLHHLNLVNVEPPPDLTARVNSASGRIAGHYLDPDAWLDAEAEGSYRQQNFNLRLSAQGNRQQVQLGSAVLALDDANLRAEGLVSLAGGNSNLNILLNAVPVSLAELADLPLPEDLTAVISGSANLQGTLEQPRVRGQLQAEGSYRAQPFGLRLAGGGTPQLVQLDQAQATVGEASLHVAGQLDLQGEGTALEVELARASLVLLELAQIEPPEGLEAELSGSASLSGSLQSPQVASRLEARGHYMEQPFQLSAHGSLLNRRLDLEKVQLRVNGATALAASGYLHPGAYDLRVEISDLPTQTLSALGWDLVTGDFNGNLHVQGTPEEPDIDGRFSYVGELMGLDPATGQSSSFELGWHTELRTEEGVLHVNSDFLRDQRETGQFELNVPVTQYLSWFRKESDASPPLVFNANGAVDLAVLSLVLDPDIHLINGRAAIRMEGSGDLDKPNLQGVFELLDTRYENRLTGTLLSEIQLLLRSEGTRVTIAEAEARGSGNGRLEASGHVDWWHQDNPNAVDISLRAMRANLINRPDLDGEVSGNLALNGSFEELWLKGHLSVTPLSANVDAALQSQIPEIEVTEIWGDDQAAESEPGPSALPLIHLDLTITAEQQAFLRGRGLEAELAGELQLTGTLEEPSYEGEFSIVRGVFEVFGRKFDLEQGQVLFANNALYMRIPGEYEHENYTIRAELAGTVEDISLSLTSVPSLPEDEILSLLIFGESAENITPFQALRLATAVQTLRGGGGGFDLVGSTRDMLGVDRLSVETASTDTGTGVSVGVGKYLSDNVYLELRRTPSETQPWQGSVEIELTPRLLLRSSTTGQAQTGAELLWTRDY